MSKAEHYSHVRAVFSRLTVKIPIREVNECWEYITKCYEGHDRHYHTLAHISHMLDEIESMSLQVKLTTDDLWIIKMATIYHDCYQVPGAPQGESEAESAALAYDDIVYLGYNHSLAGAVADLICESSHSAPPTNLRSSVFTDADKGILSDPWPNYLDYAKAVRKEYSAYSDEDYALGRLTFLDRMIELPQIYYTPCYNGDIMAYGNMGMEFELLYAFLESKDPNKALFEMPKDIITTAN